MTRDDCLHALQSNNVQGFLRLIRQGESSQNEDAYRMLFGGELFESFADHPRRLVTRGSLTSSAAGAYQFLKRTWDDVVLALGPMDFSPANQDIGAVFLINRRKALSDVLEGRINEAIRKCAPEWASLPGSQYGQPTQKLKQALEVYEAYGGQTAPQTQQPKAEVKSMVPVLIPILAELAKGLIPQLSAMFGSGSEVAQRNVAAASIVADTIVKATGALNLQEAAEKIQSDPTVLATAKEAVADVMYQLSEAGGGGIEGARKASAAPESLPFWHQGAFWVSLILILMPFMLLVDVFYVHPDTYDSNLRTQIVTAVLMVIGMVGAFWLGTSFGSQKKDALLAAR